MGSSPVAAAISIVDPVALWHSALLGIGLAVSLGLKPRRAALVVGAMPLAFWLLSFALAALSMVGRRG